MKVRAAVLILSLTAIGAAGPALAVVKNKPAKAVCNLVKDDKGDEAVSLAGARRTGFKQRGHRLGRHRHQRDHADHGRAHRGVGPAGS